MNLIDDEHFVVADLRRDAYLLDEAADIVNRVVAGGIKFMNAVGASLVKGAARFTFVTSLTIGRKMLAVDCLGKDSGAGGLAYATWTAKQVGVCHRFLLNGILQRGGQTFLTNDGVKCRRAVFSG